MQHNEILTSPSRPSPLVSHRWDQRPLLVDSPLACKQNEEAQPKSQTLHVKYWAELST